MSAREQSGRCTWIDAAKGIGISLVVLGHMNIPELLRDYIYCFHLPLFFFLSGLVHRTRPVMDLVARRTRTLVVPYLFFSAVGLAVYGLMGAYRVADYPLQLAGIAYGTTLGTYKTPVTPLWFLLCLFTTEVAFAWIVSVVGDRRFGVAVAVVALAAVGFINSKSAQVILPWGMSTSLVAILFFALGVWSGPVVGWLKAGRPGTRLGIAALLGAAVWLPTRVNGRTGMEYDNYGHVPMFLLGAIAGTGMIVIVAMLVDSLFAGVVRPPGIIGAGAVACLLYLGRNTLIILPMHILASRLAIESVMKLPLRPNSILNEAVEKSFTLALLVVSIEVFRRCPLVTSHKQPRAVACHA